MIDKPDPAKDAGRHDSPGTKRPHATLDLKATEVKQPASGSSSSSSSSAAAAAAEPGKPGEKPAGAATSQAAASPASASSVSGKPSSSASAAKPGETASGAKASAGGANGGSRGGGMVSHLAAGVLGGAIVYAGAALFGPSAELPTQPVSELEARVETVEKALRETSDLGGKLDAAENRLTQLDAIEQRLAALDDAQSKLATAQAEDGTPASAERLQKLEERLALIADGAGAAEGTVPELAAITGKLADLERSVGERLENVDASLPAESETRLAAALEAGEAAKSATERLEREIADVKDGQSAATRDAGATKSEVERLADSFKDVRRETDRLQSAVAELRASLDTSLQSVARPGDVAAALGPVASKIAEIEQSLGTVVAREDSRRENAERIVLALELANLKRAIDRGEGHAYAAELEAVEKSAGDELDLAALERFQDTGVANPSELKAGFRPVMNAAIDAETLPSDGSVIDRLMAAAKSVVRVRKVAHDPTDKSVEAVVSRMEQAVDAGRLADVIAESKNLSPKARAPMEDWLIKVSARESVDRAIARVEDRLKASLAGEPDPVTDADAEAPTAAPGTPAPESN